MKLLCSNFIAFPKVNFPVSPIYTNYQQFIVNKTMGGIWSKSPAVFKDFKFYSSSNAPSRYCNAPTSVLYLVVCFTKWVSIWDIYFVV